MEELIKFWHEIQPILKDILPIIFCVAVFVFGVISFSLRNTK